MEKIAYMEDGENISLISISSHTKAYHIICSLCSGKIPYSSVASDFSVLCLPLVFGGFVH